ncbi:MAG: phytanoyl-CoA dioxygenase family protein [Candidatus Latescibacterota bacterium]
MHLSSAQQQQFHREGYLMVRQVLCAADLSPVICEYEAHIDRRARELHAEGSLSRLYANEPFERRLACICREDNRLYRELDIMHLRGPAVFAFLRNDRLLDVVEDLVGPEITCSPIQHLRPKLPAGLSPEGSDTHVAPWHQDAGVTWAEADPHFILTVWIPLSPATPDNGCLQVVPGGVGKGLVPHEIRKGVGTTIAEPVPEEEAVTLPMLPGDVLLMHKEVPHRSTPNRSDTIRWRMDLRYQATGTPTGRPFHPDFVVRSRADPGAVLTDHAEWCRLWIEALERTRQGGYRAHRWAEAG